MAAKRKRPGAMRLVIDTNILFAAAVDKNTGAHRLLETLFSRDDWRWLATEGILDEYETVLQNTKFRTSREERAEIMRGIREKVELVEAGREIELEADPSDAKFLNCCASGGADYLITSDSDLLEAPRPGKTRIVNVHEFFGNVKE